MTPTTKRTVRESSETSHYKRQYRNIIVIVGPGNLMGFKLKGCKTVFETTVGACMSLAIKQQVQAEKAAKALKRKLKKGF
jgi:hypothetical protein